MNDAESRAWWEGYEVGKNDGYCDAKGYARRIRVNPYLKADQPAATETSPTFEEVWAQKEREGYSYGEDALEQVRFGWELAQKAKAETAPQGAPQCHVCKTYHHPTIHCPESGAY